MTAKPQALQIATLLDSQRDSADAEHHKEGIRLLLKKILPEDLFYKEDLSPQKLSYLSDSLPLIKWSEPSHAPGNLSILLLAKYRQNGAQFFYDMASRWLIPNKKLNVDLFFTADFSLPEISRNHLTVAEIIIRLKNEQELEEVRKNQKAVDTEIRLGVVSNYHANRILEFKGLPMEGKIAMIQEKIGSLIQSRSKDFDKNIFSQMQRFLISCVDEFKSSRDYHHISRIISVLYLLRKMLKQKVESFPRKRHLMLKFLKTRLSFPGSEKNVLGLLIGLNFLRDNELFEKMHLVNALKSHLPYVKPVDNSFIVDRSRENNIQTMYMEIEKEDGEDFSHDEIQLLRLALPEQLKGHIEYLMHPIFMPRNEEEILRNITVLARQLKYVSDIPQVIISFDEQLKGELSFTVIALRLLKEGAPGMEETVKAVHSNARVLIDRTRKVGTLRKSYTKEASVLRILLPVEDYFRPDLSVDLYRARKDVASLLTKLLGDMRDYNGGMIYQQNEHFTALKNCLGPLSPANELLQKFFYALAPAHMRSVLDVDALKNFFLMLLQVLRKDQAFVKKSDWLMKEESKGSYVVFPSRDQIQKKRVQLAVEALSIPSHKLISFSFDAQDFPVMGYLFLTDDKEKQKEFTQAIEASLDF
jgi:hypothetical protein